MDTVGSKPLVLIAEDEQDLRELLREQLEFGSFDVIEAKNGAEALLLIEERKPQILMSDVRMPAMSGRDLLLEARKKGYNMPVIFISAYSDVSEHWALAAGASGVFTKPFRIRDLVSFVRFVSNQDNGIHKRVYPRVREALRIDLFANSEMPFDATLDNLSQGGFFVCGVGNAPLKVGMIIDVCIPFQEGVSRTIRASAICRWERTEDSLSGAKGFGFEFQKFSNTGAEDLKILVLAIFKRNYPHEFEAVPSDTDSSSSIKHKIS